MSGLCFRCEYRAQYLENKRQPRFECGMVESAVGGCYMFKPVKPISIRSREGDNRPVTLDILSARVERVDNDIEMELREKNGLIYWSPL